MSFTIDGAAGTTTFISSRKSHVDIRGPIILLRMTQSLDTLWMIQLNPMEIFIT
jgi:hypothetical protein